MIGHRIIAFIVMLAVLGWAIYLLAQHDIEGVIYATVAFIVCVAWFATTMLVGEGRYSDEDDYRE